MRWEASFDMNAGLVHRGDRILVISSSLEVYQFRIKQKQVLCVPRDIVYCTVNKAPRIDFRSELLK